MVATRAGWIGKREVVELKYDPKLLGSEQLTEMASRCSGSCAPAPEGEIRFVEDQKYYLRQSTWSRVPMSEAQACRVHAALGSPGGAAESWLSPRQRELARRLAALPAERAPDLYGTDFRKEWWRLMAAPPPEPVETAPSGS